MTKDERIKLLSNKIEELERCRKMWLKRDGINSQMVIKTTSELKILRLEKYDLENNTHELEIYKLEHEINKLEKQKENALFIKKEIYERKIERKEAKIKTYKRSNKK